MQGTSLQLRFFVPYRDESIDYILRILPKVTVDEMAILMRFYAFNKRESGERYNRGNFLDSLVKKSY
jgi:hypothetical protein